METVLTPGKYLELHKEWNLRGLSSEERERLSNRKRSDRRRLAEETTGQREAGCAAQNAERKGLYHQECYYGLE